MAKVAYLYVETDGKFTFHRPDGSEVAVSGNKAYATDDAGEIAYLDTCPFVKRTKPSSGGGKED